MPVAPLHPLPSPPTSPTFPASAPTARTAPRLENSPARTRARPCAPPPPMRETHPCTPQEIPRASVSRVPPGRPAERADRPSLERSPGTLLHRPNRSRASPTARPSTPAPPRTRTLAPPPRRRPPPHVFVFVSRRVPPPPRFEAARSSARGGASRRTRAVAICLGQLSLETLRSDAVAC